MKSLIISIPFKECVSYHLWKSYKVEKSAKHYRCKCCGSTKILYKPEYKF
jgi:hypothetical protein